MRTVNSLDLNAPRFRRKVERMYNSDFVKDLKKDEPSINHLSTKQIRDIIFKYNENLWNTVIDYRDGIQISENIGHIFIGNCKPKVSKIDMSLSNKFKLEIKHRNWESDQHIAKIFYTTFSSKYSFKNHELWAFNATRNFKRTLSSKYPVNWKKYLQVDPYKKLSFMYKNTTGKTKKINKQIDELEKYNEFNI